MMSFPTFLIAVLIINSTVCVWSADIDLNPYADDRIVLPNPHKGWYHHYPDNHPNKYKIADENDLLKFPGMDHLYIRLAWAYIEPAEGRYDWSIIDNLISQWTLRGLGIAFRISCKETSTDLPEQQYATPRWVKEAGAKGGYYRYGKAAGADSPWEPAFDDPIFLAKLDKFLEAFATRYDGKPWLRYVDIGSIGDWGEGHTWAGSRLNYGFETRKFHTDLYKKHFQKTLLATSDDFVFAITDFQDRKRMHQYNLDHGITYRDDSILVDGYFAGCSKTFTVRSPEFFADSFLRTPTVFELEHYSAVKRGGNWEGKPNSSLAKYGGGKSGPDFFRGALNLLHATYIGYHGDAREWYQDNPQLTGQLLNQCGYWYFLKNCEIPSNLILGKTNEIKLSWQNRGVAPAYNSYHIKLKFQGPSNTEIELPSGNQRWLPGTNAWQEKYAMALPPSMSAGKYDLFIKLYSPQANKDVRLALSTNLLTENGFYRVCSVNVNTKP